MTSDSDTIRVLHVDDEPGFANMTASFLESTNDRFEVASETSASEGWQVVRETAIDCVVSDYDMPGQSGIEFLETVREEYPDLPFILFTQKGGEEVASDAISADVTDYMQKDTGTDQYTVLANRIENTVESYRSRHELEESQKRLSMFFEQSPLGVIEWNDAFEFVRVNDAAQRILGYEESELRGHSWEYIVPPAERGSVGDVIESLLENAGGYQNVNRNVTKGGETIRCEWHNRVITDESGDVVAVFSQFQDVTEREERERELRETNRQLEAVVDTISAIVVLKDLDGNYLLLNQTTREWLGLEDGKTVKKRDSDDVYPEAVVERATERDQRVLETGKTMEFEERIPTVEGPKTILTLKSPVYDEDGEPYAVCAVGTDITEREERKRELERTKRQFDAVFNNPVSFMGILNRDGTVRRINEMAREFVDLDHDDVAGELFWETPWWNHSDELQADLEAWIERTVDGEVVRYEADHYAPDGEQVTIDGTLYPVIDEDENVTSIVVVGRDISKRIERERTLERQNEWLDEFASVVSHDLRNPLNVASGKLELAREACDSEHLDGVQRAHDRIYALIEELLTIARQDDIETDVSAVELPEVVEECWQNVETSESTFVVETDRAIKADGSQLKRLLENLIRNAVEHGGDDVTITVGDFDDGFYVEDDGRGIPEADRERVFEFGHSGEEGGTGLGLAIVKEIADVHDWNICVTEGTKGGSRFEITDVEIV